MSSEDSNSRDNSDRGIEKFANYPLVDALLKRRSRRFSQGMEIEGGPTSYSSNQDPRPLTEEEEAILAFAACGITGPALADLPYTDDSGGNVISRFVGRTVSSQDAVHTMAVFVINDEGTWLARRPQDIDSNELAEIIELTRNEDFLEAWQKMRVKIADSRKAPPVKPPFNINPNRWSLHSEGTTYFLLVTDTTYSYINTLLEILNEETGIYLVDERRMFRSAGLGDFAKSNGGHLDDDPRNGKVLPLGYLERSNVELNSIEQGMALQNLGLVCQAMGLSGFPHYTQHDEAWFEELDFRMGEMPLAQFMAMPFPASTVLQLKGQNVSMSYPLGLEKCDETLLKPYCPPYYDSMEDAVRAVVEHKFGAEGIFRGGNNLYESEDLEKGWENPEEITNEVPEISERAINATIAYCEYIWDRYQRFPATYPPFHTLMGFQAGHIDEGFYNQYYRPKSLDDSHRKHMDHWHRDERE